MRGPHFDTASSLDLSKSRNTESPTSAETSNKLSLNVEKLKLCEFQLQNPLIPGGEIRNEVFPPVRRRADTSAVGNLAPNPRRWSLVTLSRKRQTLASGKKNMPEVKKGDLVTFLAASVIETTPSFV